MRAKQLTRHRTQTTVPTVSLGLVCLWTQDSRAMSGNMCALEVSDSRERREDPREAINSQIE